MVGAQHAIQHAGHQVVQHLRADLERDHSDVHCKSATDRWWRHLIFSYAIGH